MNLSQSRRRALGTIAVIALVTACGGGGDDNPNPISSQATTGRARALATATPAQSQWGPLIPLTLVPSASANLPNGKVLVWAANTRYDFNNVPGNTYTAVFDPATGTSVERLVTETNHNMFCPGTTNLPDGRILVNGGSSSSATSLYNPSTGTWTSGPLMNIPRAYEANTLLTDGSVLTLGGSWNGGAGGKNAEIWTAAGGWRLLPGVPVDPMIGPDPGGVYRGDNHMWLIPTANWKVLQAGPSAAMNWIDTRGNGVSRPAGPRGDDAYSINGSTVMYDIGKILKTGGAPAYENLSATSSTQVIDVGSGTPSVRRVTPMAYQRGFHNSVVLPNGEVLIVGGQTLTVPLSDNNSVLVPELWDPATERFTLLPAMLSPRNYHSSALLLPDARVASIGGGLCGAGCSANHPDLQILTPHYLLNPDGSAAVRPAITAGGTEAAYGSSLAIGTDSPVTAFALLRMSSNTHTVNNDQRRIPLQFTTTGTNHYALAIPSNPGIALPGYYMLFALNANGVPSVAKTIRISADATPMLQSPGDLQFLVGTGSSYNLAASGSGTITFAATGLPPGLSLNPSTGAISGTPSTVGTYSVTVSAGNAAGKVSADLLWTVQSSLASFTRYAKLEALTEANGQVWTSVAEFNLLDTSGAVMSRTGWLATADSENGGNAAANAVDGNTATLWHTQTYPTGAPLPHNLTVDRGSNGPLIGGFKMLPRQDGSVNGRIGSWRFHVSPNGVDWRMVASGTFANDATEKTVFPINTAPANQGPALATPPNPSVTVGKAVSVALSASDPNGDTLSYAVTNLPPGLTVNASTGAITGTPTTAGTYNAVVVVSDGRGGTASATMVWTVQAGTPTNQNPVLTTPPNPTSTVGVSVSVALSATDPNGDTLSYAVSNLPPGLAVNASTGVISGTPTTAGTYGNVVVVVSDGRGGSATATIVWTVQSATSTNQNPVLTTPANPTSTVGTAATLALSATDPNGDTLSYAVTNLPPGLTVSASTGVISGTPTTAGTFNAAVVVSDGRGGTASATIVWTVLAAGSAAPASRYVKLEALTEVNGNAWTSVAEFNLLDANNTVMSRAGWAASADSQQGGYEAAKAIDGTTTTFWHTQWSPTSPPPPHSLVIDRGTGTLAAIGGFKMMPRQDGGVNGRIASWRFHVSADGATWRLIASGTFANDATEKSVLAVDPLSVNQNPVLTTPANPTSTVGTAASLALSASDPNGDNLTYAVTNLPPGLTVNTSTGVISGTPTTSGTYNAVIVVSDGHGGSATATIVWTVQAAVAAPSPRYVKLEALTEVNGNAWTSVAEFNLLDANNTVMSRAGWVASADSQQGGYEAAKAIDGTTTTFWHTQWSPISPPPPHSLVIDRGTGTLAAIGGFKMLPRQDGGVNGRIASWRFHVSADSVTWRLVASGTFANDATEKTVAVTP